MRVKILRQQTPVSKPYWEIFNYEGPSDNTVAGLLDYLNYHDDITDINGNKTTRIGWECSCLQGMCGGCAMVINEVPSLACETFIKDVHGSELTIRPLRKFPVIHDLVVDRSIIHENLMKADIFIGEYHPSRDKDKEHQYSVAKCLKCGLCLEICPNYVDGKSFFGALFANDSYLVTARNSEKKEKIKKAYNEHFGKSCSKSFSCMDICPMKIQTIASMAKMNRLK